MKPFFNLIDLYSDGKMDQSVRNMVESIYRNSVSAPWPRKWIENLLKSYESAATGKPEDFHPMKKLVDMAKAYILDAYEMAQNALKLCLEPQGPTKYVPRIEQELSMIEVLLQANSYDDIYQGMTNISFDRIPSITAKDGVDENLKEQAVALRNEYKSSLLELKDKYFYVSWDEICKQQERVLPIVKELVRLALEVNDAILEEKKKRRVIDFSDMEHFALQILVNEETGMPNPVAEVFHKHFKEIMIDEYQDSNDVQEAILKSISGYYEGKNNMFMVGDVKQSIYRFRMAKPELFVEKYNQYSQEDSLEQRIDLQKNYRSRAGVLEFCNVIFRMLMEPELGGIVYDESAQLNPGASYDESDFPCAEVLLIEPKEIKAENVELEDENALRLEAMLVAQKIKELHGVQTVQEKEGVTRPAEYKDFVVLLRSIRSAGPVFQEVLNAYGIPAHVDSTTGYFSAPEVNLVLDVLTLVDNPNQDIPMASVLKSVLVGLDDDELAEIKVNSKEGDCSFAESAIEWLKEQNHSFYFLLQEMRERKDLTVHEMIQLLFKKTGYDSYVAALPAGKTRYGNLMTLVEKAITFESTSYKGVFHFLRYIHQMKKYEKDFGEADIDGESGNVVHIMTIHKSKGLEYPVVFVSGLARSFNAKDENGDLLVHQDMGIGINEIYFNEQMTGKPRVKNGSLIRATIKNFIHQETLGEELRVLYVALTRAKERLILTGAKIPKNIDFGGENGYGKKLKARCFIDWIVPALYAAGWSNTIQEIDAEYLSMETFENEIVNAEAYGDVLNHIANADVERVKLIKEALSFEYPYKNDISRKSKYSVSELKHAAMERIYDAEEGEAELPSFMKQKRDPFVPSFASKIMENNELQFAGDGTPAGALFGTAVHRMMEVLDFAAFYEINKDDENELQAFAKRELERMSDSGELEAELKSRLRGPELLTFLKSDISSEMAEAAARGELYREKPFVIAREDGTLIQGIIDAFWREPDGSIVLLDYKTDKVADKEALVKMYKEQLELYADALSRIYGNVKSKLIYSYRLKEVISL